MGRGAQRAKANNCNLLWLKQKELVCDESSAFAISPPCGSCSVFEVAHTVYKYALNKCSFIHLRALHAKHQASTRTELRFEFLSLSF